MENNFRGIKKVVMVNVLEGDGKNTPLRIVHYIFDMEEHGGLYGGLVGKIDNLPAQSNMIKERIAHIL